MRKTLAHMIFMAAAFCCAAFALASCKGPVVPSDQEIFSERTSVCLMVGYKNMVDFSIGDLQYSSNATKHIYRAGATQSVADASTGITVQTVQQYFVLKLNEAPGEVNSAVKGTLVLCSPTIAAGIRSYNIQNGTILKRDDNLAWIWDSVLHLGVVVHL